MVCPCVCAVLCCAAQGLAQGSAAAKCGKCVEETAKCVKNEAGVWTVVPDIKTTASCTAPNQWILASPQMPYPDHHPSSKTHWMKRMSDTRQTDADHHDHLYIGGQPAERDIKLLYEAGVDAILNVVPQTTNTNLGVQKPVNHISHHCVVKVVKMAPKIVM